jgi:hypothetical protein
VQQSMVIPFITKYVRFPDAVTKHHKLGGPKLQVLILIVFDTGHSKSRCPLEKPL